MEPLIGRLQELTSQLTDAWAALKLDDLYAEQQQLAGRMAQPDFWQDV